MKYQRILLIRKAAHKGAQALAQQIHPWLEAHGCSVTTIEAGRDDAAYKQAYDCAIVLGGDGTLLGVARNLAGKNTPMLGINFGRVGFLTDAQPSTWESTLAQCLGDSLPTRSCLALQWNLVRDGTKILQGHATNDVVLSRGSLARLVCTHIFANEQSLGYLRSDGIILATPIGSSGYNVSAGGSLLYCDMNAIAFTPICPFMNTISHMVFPGDMQFKIHIEPGSTDCYLTIDGQEGELLHTGDQLNITGLPGGVLFLGTGHSYFDRLRNRTSVLKQQP